MRNTIYMHASHAPHSVLQLDVQGASEFDVSEKRTPQFATGKRTERVLSAKQITKRERCMAQKGHRTVGPIMFLIDTGLAESVAYASNSRSACALPVICLFVLASQTQYGVAIPARRLKTYFLHHA